MNQSSHEERRSEKEKLVRPYKHLFMPLLYLSLFIRKARQPESYSQNAILESRRDDSKLADFISRTYVRSDARAGVVVAYADYPNRIPCTLGEPAEVEPFFRIDPGDEFIASVVKNRPYIPGQK